jgi:PAS domain S-box-containing protein
MLSWLNKSLNGALGEMRRSAGSLSSLARSDRSSGKLAVVAAILAIAIFVVDIALPLGVAGGVPYVAVVLLGLWFKSTRPLFFLATISSVLTIAGYFFSPVGGILWVDLTNRILALSAIWVTAVLLAKAKAAESRTETVADRLTTVLDSAVISILTIDAKGTVTSFNPAAEKLFGYRADEVTGRNVSMLMPEPYRGAHDDYIANYLDSGQAKIIGRTREAAALRKDGQTFPIVLSVGETWSNSERFFVGFVTDITERKRAEMALLASERRFRDVADVASDWIWETDADLRYSYFSEQMENLTGLSARELLGKAWSALPWANADDPGLKRLAEDLNNRRSFRDIETAVKLSGGRLCYMRIGGKPVFDDHGNFEGYRGTGTDITTQVEAEAEMTRRTALFEGIIENAVEGIYRVTADGQYISANPALAKMHGYDSPELFLEIFPNRADVYDRPEAREEVARHMREEGSVRGFECGAKKRGGSRF